MANLTEHSESLRSNWSGGAIFGFEGDLGRTGDVKVFVSGGGFNVDGFDVVIYICELPGEREVGERF